MRDAVQEVGGALEHAVQPFGGGRVDLAGQPKREEGDCEEAGDDAEALLLDAVVRIGVRGKVRHAVGCREHRCDYGPLSH